VRSEEEIRDKIQEKEKEIHRTTGQVNYEKTMRRKKLRSEIKLLKWVLEE
jgi:hypothetical protein